MTSQEKYDHVFIEVLELESGEIPAGLAYQSVARWDSLGHVELISQLEEAFDVRFDVDETIDFDSYEMGKRILERHDVRF